LKPVYKKTAAYGHFGREEFTWEKTPRAAKMADDLSRPSATKVHSSKNGTAHHEPKKRRGKKDARAVA
jgi:S-adenosylmethionine synthetase